MGEAVVGDGRGNGRHSGRWWRAVVDGGGTVVDGGQW